MSRSKRGSRPSGYDCWSSRPKAQHCPGRYGKTLTHKVERQQAKSAVRKELKDE